MGKKVRKTLNIDAKKLKRVKEYLGVGTETEAIDRLLDQMEYERELHELVRHAAPSWRTFRSPLARRGGR